MLLLCLVNTNMKIWVGREGYISAEGVTSHLANVGDVLNEALQYADIVELQVQGPAEELEKLKEPLAAFGATHYPLSEGSFRSKKPKDTCGGNGNIKLARRIRGERS